jgi:hypothetical protein
MNNVVIKVNGKLVDLEDLFTISVWNQFDNDGSRTNNTVEGYNLKLNNFLSSHPNVWIFIRNIQSEE